MKALFWSVFTILLFLAPFSLRLDGDFCLKKKTAFTVVRFFGVRVFSILLYFSPDGVYYSLFGKKGKKIIVKSEPTDPSGKKKMKIPFSIDALKFTDISVKMYLGGDVENVTAACGTATTIADAFFTYLEGRKLLDRGSFLILPSYTADQTTVNFSIRVFTLPIKVLSSLIHTNSGEKYAKRRYRQHNE